MIFLLDNYDSFTYNLYQYLGELGAAVTVARNDQITAAAVMRQSPRAVIISPGPGRPADAGISKALVQACAERRLPFLGVCLGHQALGEAFGGQVVSAPALMHGKTSDITHDGKTIFRDIASPMRVMRYHSLMLERASIQAAFVESAVNDSDGELMAMRHRELPLEGVQFHPESIMTPQGKALLQNFLQGYLGD